MTNNLHRFALDLVAFELLFTIARHEDSDHQKSPFERVI